jgi:hypothetical protein
MNLNEALFEATVFFGFIIILLIFSFYLGTEYIKNHSIWFNNKYDMLCSLSNTDLKYYDYELVNYGWMLKCNYAEGSIIYEINSFNMTGIICDWCANTILRSPDII